MERFFGYARQLTDPGELVATATITIYEAGTLTLAAIYEDNLPTPTPQINPFLSDADGFFFFYAVDGRYDVRVTGGTPPVTAYTWGDIQLGLGSVTVPSSTFAGLPTPDPAQAGRLARVTDTVRGLWQDSGIVWVQTEGGAANVLNFGAVGDGVTDDTAAIQAAIDACQGGSGFSDGGGNKVLFPRPPVVYRVAGRLLIPTDAYRGLVLEGVGHEGSRLKFTDPAAGITIRAGQVRLRDLFLYGDGINGAGVANNILLIDGAEEWVLDNVTIYNCALTALRVVGSSIGRMVNNTRLSVASVLLELDNSSALSVTGSNFFQVVGVTDMIRVINGTGSLAFQGTWFEGFRVLLGVDNTDGANLCSMISFAQCRLLSTLPAARMTYIQSNSFSPLTLRVMPLVFRDCDILLTDSSYPIFIAINGNTSPNTAVGILCSNIAFAIPPALGLAIADSTAVQLIAEHVIGVADADYMTGDGTVVGASGAGPFGYQSTLAVRGVGVLPLIDGVIAPTTVADRAQIYVDTGDGDLKIRFADGTIRTIVTD